MSELLTVRVRVDQSLLAIGGDITVVVVVCIVVIHYIYIHSMLITK